MTPQNLEAARLCLLLFCILSMAGLAALYIAGTRRWNRAVKAFIEKQTGQKSDE